MVKGRQNYPIPFDEFLKRVRESHGGDVFEFDKSEYSSLNSLLTVACKKCHKKFQKYGYSLQTKYKCPHCERDRLIKEFLEEAKKKFGKKFSYKFGPDRFYVEYIDNKNVKVICNKCHNDFERTRIGFLHGDGICPHCRMLEIEKNCNKEFIEKAKNKFGDRFSYKLVNNSRNVIITCNKCNSVIDIQKKSFLHSNGICPNCKKIEIANNHNKEFIEKAKAQFGDRFSYEKVSFLYDSGVGNQYTDYVEIFCNKCKKYFKIGEKTFLKNGICKNCEKAEKRRKDKKIFLEKAKEKYKDLYNYKKVKYKNDYTPVEIICKKCGNSFFTTPYGHINNKYGGCKTCEIRDPIKIINTSNGEKLIKELLDQNNINYICQKMFNGCKDKNFLRFDFYLPERNLCIEYQGQQHYKNNFFLSICKTKKEGKQKFKTQQLHDKMKKQYCKDNNIGLFEITYKDNVEEKLNEILNLK